MTTESNTWTGEIVGIYMTATATATGEPEMTRELPPTIFIDCGEGVLSATGLSTSYENQVKKDWRKIKNQIISFASLQMDWDEMGGTPPPPELIDSALVFLNEMERSQDLPPPVRTVPTNEGGVVIEWQFNGSYLEAEISEPFLAEWMYAEPDQPIMHWEESWGKVKQGTTSTFTREAA